MKSRWWMYVIVSVIAAGAGIAVAGLPDNPAVDATIVAPASTVAAAATTSATTAVPSTTEVPVTTPPPPDTDPTATDPPTTEPKNTRPPRTDPPATEPPANGTLPPLAEPAALTVVVANGAEIGGVAARTAAQLVALGYTDTSPTDAEVAADVTVIYFADPFLLEAVRMTGELGLLPESVALIVEAPPVLGGIEGVELLVYLGRDQA